MASAPSDVETAGRAGGRIADLLRAFVRQIPALILLAALLLAWEFGVTFGWIKAYLFPPPSEIYDTFKDLLVEGFPPGLTLFSHIAATIPRVLQGFMLAAALAIPLGLVVGQFMLLREATQPLVTFFRSIAVISLLPVALAIFGPGEEARIALIAYAAFWIIFTNTIEGAYRIPRDLLRAGTALGASGFRLYLNVALPATLPKIFAGLKVALGISWVVIVAVELIGTEAGIGALISNAQRLYRTDIVVVGMFAIGLIGYLLMIALDALEAWLLPWAASGNRLEGAR